MPHCEGQQGRLPHLEGQEDLVGRLAMGAKRVVWLTGVCLLSLPKPPSQP